MKSLEKDSLAYLSLFIDIKKSQMETFDGIGTLLDKAFKESEDMEKKEEEKIYVWWPENTNSFTDTFSSVDEAIEAAQAEFDNEEETYEDGTEYNSPIIEIAQAKAFPLEDAVRSFVEGMDDYLLDYVSDFAAGTDCESEAQISDRKEFIDKATKVLLPLVKEHTYIYPSYVTTIHQGLYDLQRKAWQEVCFESI